MGRDSDSPNRRRVAAFSAATMADRHTPLIRNAWYVAALGSEVDRELRARWLLGRSVLLFRNTAGEAVALQNRCCHRSFPLHHGRLEGDVLQCGYHGFRYDCEGRCIGVPSQAEPPGNIRLRRYRVVERGPFVWFWGGEWDEADESLLPHPRWLGHPDWDFYIGYLGIKGNYVHLHENLLDLSHLSFLHETSFGTPEYARAPIEVTLDEPRFEVWRHVDCTLPAIYAEPLGWQGEAARRSSGARFVAPGLHINTGILRNLARPAASAGDPPTIQVAQLITPEDNDSTHYWFAACRNFARADAAVDAFMLQAQRSVFEEDLFAIEQIAVLEQREPDGDFFESNVRADRAGVAMRRYLKKLADAERR